MNVTYNIKLTFINGMGDNMVSATPVQSDAFYNGGGEHFPF